MRIDTAVAQAAAALLPSKRCFPLICIKTQCFAKAKLALLVAALSVNRIALHMRTSDVESD